MKKKILIAGGDMRQIYCAERLSQNYDIFILGIERSYFPDNMQIYEAGDDMEFEYAVLPVVPPDENGNISAPLYNKNLTVAEVQRFIKRGSVVFIGTDAERSRMYFPNSTVIAYMDSESISLKNAIPSAEGAVQVALEELPVTLNGLSVLIAGLGRIGTSLVLMLKGFGADITVAVRNECGAAKARMFGIKSVYTGEINGDFQLVFNTVPNLIFDSSMLEKFPADTLFIDLASRPGGFDFNAAKKTGKKVIWALGLPGKTAPKTAGIAVAETILNILSPV
ncbi:MAG: dipicolinate synthase subunit A [Ruminococcus sp.]|nr:dipicolinate synthase subunit A [Ruminococcus sp.]MDE6784648.1 dipicolinate synthase subunit A [Ruminococcus sp.]